MTEQFTYDDLRVVERWLADQIRGAERYLRENPKENNGRSAFIVMRNALQAEQSVVRTKLEALNDFAVKQAIAKHGENR